jgi:hypothetical protein
MVNPASIFSYIYILIKKKWEKGKRKKEKREEKRGILTPESNPNPKGDGERLYGSGGIIYFILF